MDNLTNDTDNGIIMNMQTELVMHREFNDDDEMIREDSFIIDNEYLQRSYAELFKNKYENIGMFLRAYDPEIEGKELYNQAFKDDALIYDNVSSIGSERLSTILINLVMELQEKTFEMDNEELSKYLKQEIGITDGELKVIYQELDLPVLKM